MSISSWIRSLFSSVYPLVYVVKPGDTLSAISQRYYGKASEYHKIYNANRDQLHDPDKIYPGQRLRIPR